MSASVSGRPCSAAPLSPKEPRTVTKARNRFAWAVVALALSLLVPIAGAAGPAQAAKGVKVSSSGERIVWASTSGAGLRADFTFTILDPQGLGTSLRSCTYDFTVGEYRNCRSQKLRKTKYLRPIAKGWAWNTWLQYTNPVSPAQCDNANYYRPKFKVFLWVLDKEGKPLTSGKHGLEARCLG